MKILMRGAIDPLRPMDPAKFIIENHTGGNIGNMIFTHSIAKTLLVDDDTTIDYVNIAREKMDRYYADYVNDTYDYFVIPLANAFKVRGHEEMTKIANFVKMLKIPIGVVGVGIQRKIGPERFSDIYPHCDEAKNFVSAILDKSPIIGVRGETTAEFLTDLGFKAEKDFTVIGCPSMYTYGDTLPEIKPLELSENSRIAFNSKIEFEKLEDYKPFMEFTKKNMELFPNYCYVQQQIDDVRMIFLENYKVKRRKNKMYDINKALSFVDIPSWIEYFKNDVDFSVGSRIHGNVASVLAGTPAVTVPFDRRVLELADYHNIPLIGFDEINENTTLYDIAEKVDFNAVHKGHKERFDHYIDFLHKLNLDTIYDHEYENGVIPYDKIVAEEKFNGPILPFEIADKDEQLKRLRASLPIIKAMEVDEAKQIKKLQEENEKLRADLKEATLHASIFHKAKLAKKYKDKI